MKSPFLIKWERGDAHTVPATWDGMASKKRFADDATWVRRDLHLEALEAISEKFREIVSTPSRRQSVIRTFHNREHPDLPEWHECTPIDLVGNSKIENREIVMVLGGMWKGFLGW